MAIKTSAAAGPLFAEGLDGGAGRPAKALSHAASELAQAWGLPYSEALRRLANELANNADVQLFVRDGIGFLTPLTDDRILGSAVQSSKIDLSNFKRFQTNHAEIAQRGVPRRLGGHDSGAFNKLPAGSFGYQPAQMPQEAEPQLNGRAGALDLLQNAATWAGSPDAFRPRGTIAKLAMLSSDVAMLAGGSSNGDLRSTQAPARTAKAAPPELRLVPDRESCAQACEAAKAACKPPPDFKKGAGWKGFHDTLLTQFQAMTEAGLTYEGALIELHARWGYAKRQNKDGGPLAKVLTKAKSLRSAGEKRRGGLAGSAGG